MGSSGNVCDLKRLEGDQRVLGVHWARELNTHEQVQSFCSVSSVFSQFYRPLLWITVLMSDGWGDMGGQLAPLFLLRLMIKIFPVGQAEVIFWWSFAWHHSQADFIHNHLLLSLLYWFLEWLHNQSFGYHCPLLINLTEGDRDFQCS